MNKKYAGFMKFGKKEHMQEFYSKGELYLNTFKYFEALENCGDGRADKNEYSKRHYSGDGIIGHTFTFSSGDKTLTFKGGVEVKSITEKEENINKYTHLYCLSAIDVDWSIKNNLIINPKNFAPQKDYVVFIHKPDEFYKKLYKTLTKVKRLKKNFRLDYIEYVDPLKYSGDMGCFKKFNEYEYQNEYRLAIKFLNYEPQRIYIGSLVNVAYPPMTKDDFYKLEIGLGSHIIKA